MDKEKFLGLIGAGISLMVIIFLIGALAVGIKYFWGILL
jgi:hypothetical protein